jgi:hypothetical protein
MMHKSYGDTLSPKRKLCNIAMISIKKHQVIGYQEVMS